MNKTKKKKKRDKNVLKFYQNYTYKKEQLEEKEKRRNTIYYTKINIILYQFLHRIKPKILKNKNAHKDE